MCLTNGAGRKGVLFKRQPAAFPSFVYKEGLLEILK